MAIAEGYKTNLETLSRAFSENNVCLMECTEIATGNTVTVICAVFFDKDNGEYHFTPFAKMFDGNPYEEINPPA
jgi:hypothetical protein